MTTVQSDYLSRARSFNWLVFLKVEPLFDSLQSELRFSALLGYVALALSNEVIGGAADVVGGKLIVQIVDYVRQ